MRAKWVSWAGTSQIYKFISDNIKAPNNEIYKMTTTLISM